MYTAEGNAGLGVRLVIVRDDMPMRRAQLSAFLCDWAAMEGVELLASEMPAEEAEPGLAPECRMVIFSIGSLAFDRSPALQKVLGIAEAYQQVPVVVLAEAGSARDAAIAFQAGARGYIPASIEPEVALKALSFILHGGHFFPPTALQVPRPTGRGGNDDGSRYGMRGRVFHARLGTGEVRKSGAA